ncbi:MAG: hypothetical protein [Bacteriophage sp.]|nr:MAG: hypothetical protein [Bacteriophage sp.]
MFSYHKYNNFILIQEIFDKFWCECNGDKAALTAAALENLKQLCQERANAMECDCPEVKTWSANAMLSGDPCNGLSGSTSALRCSYEVSYNNQCGSSKSITVTVTGRNDHGQTVTAGSTSVSIPTGSGKKTGVIGFDSGVQCGSISVSGGGSGNC